MTEHEELLMLRELAAKQKQQLEEKDRIIEEKNEKIEKQNIQIENMIQALPSLPVQARDYIFSTGKRPFLISASTNGNHVPSAFCNA